MQRSSEKYAPDFSQPGGYPAHGGHHGYHSGHPGYPPVINQPSTVQSTNVVVNAGGPGARKRPWSTQICACMEDVSGCLCAMCCFPCMMMTLATRMHEFCCMPFLVPNALFPMRVQVRAANRIKGTICRDCVMTTCCTLCAACQLKRELDNIDARKPSTDL